MEINAKIILSLLACKHKNDVFVPECKNGPTWNENHRRLDAVAIRRSWVNPVITGYEIKISRSDFLNDKKWLEYLPYCNKFYFVTPWGLISRKEVPVEAGLIYVAKTGTRLYTRRNVLYRRIKDPANMFRYILYSRARIVSSNEMYYPGYSLEYWKNWLAAKHERTYVGARVSHKIRREMANKTSENLMLKQEIKRLKIELEHARR